MPRGRGCPGSSHSWQELGLQSRREVGPRSTLPVEVLRGLGGDFRVDLLAGRASVANCLDDGKVRSGVSAV